MTSVVDGLVARSYVERSADPGDRRRVMLSLTTAGTTAMHLGDELVGSGLNRLLQRLEPEQAEHALVGLELLNQAMEASLEERFGPQFNEVDSPAAEGDSDAGELFSHTKQ
jgi:DNA-binding MarR family transcriptional regulator